MPLLRYFGLVGAALLALLLIVAVALPMPQAETAAMPSSKAPPIRISSDVKWPERIVLDTTQPSTAPPPMAHQMFAPKPASGDEAAKARARASFAQSVPLNAKSSSAAVVERQRAKRRIARQHPAHQAKMAAQQEHDGFGWLTW